MTEAASDTILLICLVFFIVVASILGVHSKNDEHKVQLLYTIAASILVYGCYLVYAAYN